jgi:hypothetical protein
MAKTELHQKVTEQRKKDLDKQLNKLSDEVATADMQYNLAASQNGRKLGLEALKYPY